MAIRANTRLLSNLKKYGAVEMRTYGMVAEDEQDGDYFKYRLVPVKKGA